MVYGTVSIPYSPVVLENRDSGDMVVIFRKSLTLAHSLARCSCRYSLNLGGGAVLQCMLMEAMSRVTGTRHGEGKS